MIPTIIMEKMEKRIAVFMKLMESFIALAKVGGAIKILLLRQMESAIIVTEMEKQHRLRWKMAGLRLTVTISI